jgi:hypothetical protein
MHTMENRKMGKTYFGKWSSLNEFYRFWPGIFCSPPMCEGVSLGERARSRFLLVLWETKHPDILISLIHFGE